MVKEFLSLVGRLEHTIILDVLADIPGKHTLTHHRCQEVLIAVLGRAKYLELIVLVAFHLVGCVSTDDIDDILGLEAFLERNDSLDGCTQLIACLDTFAGMHAVVAIAAILLKVRLAEIVKQCLAAAHRRFGIICGFVEQLLANLLFGNGFSLHELLQFLQVFLGVESDALALTPITSGTSCRLIVSF